MADNIYPVFDRIYDRKVKEEILRQSARVIWFTGLSGSGKTTLAANLEKELFFRRFFCQVLDGDNIRLGINNNLGFSGDDRLENIRRISEVSKLLINAGIITICSFISPTNKIREMAKNIIGRNNFIEIYLSTPLDVCEKRDTKGLYKRARSGEIKDFTGISAPFDVPACPDIEIDTSKYSVRESVDKIFATIIDRITL
ncbi:MAG: adenylyl-sulfate kinase [Bacteroidales bacterium]|nr:adenylyl-sulfate kinase [Bacteroidales bacterium]